MRYSETDAMSYSHHSNYLKYYEVGRLDWLKKIGFSYFEMEKNNIILPVVETKTVFRKPAFFEDKLKIKTTLLNPPSYSLEFQYEIFKNKILINEGYTKLIFLNKKNNKPIRCPKNILDAIGNF
ncbi:MAG: acyl-CoA thioesterase [Cryomorphaceae bacterium]|nr:MAG: acyl-CoA thioesterase [Cryomorphaceae bacterium]